MFLTKDGITLEITHPAEIARYKALGFVEEKIGYPNPEIVTDGEKPADPAPEAEKPADKPRGKAKDA
jgi:hypothetical protein